MVEEAGGLARARLPARTGRSPRSSRALDFVQRHTLALTLLDRSGAGCLPPATAMSRSSCPWVLTEESGWGSAYNIELTTIARREEHQVGYIADVDAWLAGTKQLQTWQSGELPGPVIDSLVTGTARELPVNIPNDGQVPDVDDEVVVESICVVDDKGVRGRDAARLPRPFAELLRRHGRGAGDDRRCGAVRRPRLATAAFLLDPLAGRGDLGQTEAMVEELLSGTARWLPQFNG